MTFFAEKVTKGFSNTPTNREPIKAPTAAPKIIDNLLLEEI